MYTVYTMFFKKGAPTDPNTGKPLPPHRPLWKDGDAFELRVYISEDEQFADFNNTEALIWHEKGFYLDWKPSNDRVKDVSITASKAVMNNATLYAHIYFTKAGYSPDPQSSRYRKSATLSATHVLNKYLPKPKVTGKKNLISGELADTPEMIEESLANKEQQILISFWKPNLTLHLVHDFTRYPRGGLPPQIAEKMRFDEEGNYYPTLYINEFFVMREHLYPINETTPSLPLRMEYATLSLWKWQLMIQMDQSLAMQESLGMVEGEKDEVKRMLFETNPYLLALTLIVSLLHTIFDFLAFKNDITFWKNRKSIEGLSVRTIFLNVFFQVVIFLYLLDNDTSWIILISSGVGLLIEAWKITKALDVSVQRIPGSSIPRIQFKDKASYSAKTKEHDQVAMKYLSFVLYPLVVCYAIYSLCYETHKSWYSWILSSLTGCIYTFGFIMMTPQLFINYKLKSVAHMPWKTFMYKALNTFVDDLFAFIIKMPTMHRVACFRDDIVFFIFLYQRWIYPVDKTRMNEYGQGGVQEVSEGEEKKEQ